VLASNRRDIVAGNAEVAELAVGQARQLAHRVAVTEPGAELLADGLERGHGTLLVSYGTGRALPGGKPDSASALHHSQSGGLR